MKLEPDYLDDIFKKRLHDAEAAPPAFVWDNLERELQKRRRRRFFIWLFAFGVASAGLWAMLDQRKANTPTANTEQVFLENKKETSAANKSQNRPETPKPEPAKETPAAPAPKSQIQNWSVKGGILQPHDIEALSDQSESDGLSLSQPVAVLDAAQAQGDFTGFLPLENNALEPLAFSRKEPLPQAAPKLFIRKKKDSQHCYNFTENPNVWMVDAYFGPSFANQTLTAADPSDESYRQMRLATE